MPSKVYMYYIVDSQATIKTFKTIKAAKEFKSRFEKKYTDPFEGYWVEMIIKGSMIYYDKGFGKVK